MAAAGGAYLELGDRGERRVPAQSASSSLDGAASRPRPLDLNGIPQVGSILGVDSFVQVRTAPATLIVYADVASAGFARFDRLVLPTLVRDYIRAKRLDVRLRTVPAAGGGTPHTRSALVAQAAGLQTRLWEFVDALAVLGQSRPESARIALAIRRVPAVDGQRILTDSRSPRVNAAVLRATISGAAAHVRNRPVFVLLTSRGTQPLPPTSTGPRLLRAIQRALARSGVNAG